MERKRYLVTIHEAILNWGTVEVEAETPQEAERIAEDQYDPDQLTESTVDVEVTAVVEK